jgi:SurA-like N-terminal domain
VSRQRVSIAGRLLGVLLAVAGLGLVACQPSAGTAAFVGEHRVTDRQVQDEVSQALADPDVRSSVSQQYGADLTQFRRLVLNEEIRHQLIAQVAGPLGLRADPTEVSALIKNSGGLDAIRSDGHLSVQLAQQRYEDMVLLAEIGYAKGGVSRPDDASLRATYEKAKDQQAIMQLAVVPLNGVQALDQAYAQVRANPDAFDSIAAAVPGASAKPIAFRRAGLPQIISKAKAGDFVRYVGVGADAGGFFLVKVFSIQVPTFEDLKLQLSLPVLDQAQGAGIAYTAKYAGRIGVRVSPRYGTWDPKILQIGDTPGGGAVSVTTPKPSAPAPGPDQGGTVVPPGAPAGS